MFPELNGAQMGALSHFVQDALVRKLVDKGLLSGSDVLAIMGDAASNLGRFGQSDARAALGALENKIIPAAQQRAQVRAREAATPSKSKGTVRNGIATVTFWLFIVLAAISIVGGVWMISRSGEILVTVLPFFITAGLLALAGFGARQLIRSK